MRFVWHEIKEILQGIVHILYVVVLSYIPGFGSLILHLCLIADDVLVLVRSIGAVDSMIICLSRIILLLISCLVQMWITAMD